MRIATFLAALAYAGTTQAKSTKREAADDQFRSINRACQALAARFPTRLFLPNTENYAQERTAFWSMTTVLSPTCVFRPGNANDISKGLDVIRQNKSPFAVRSGGHMPNPGAASTDRGVLIAMTDINTKNLIENNSIVQIGPGQTWQQVYTWLAGFGLATNGGRYAPVGVGGFLLGGGISFFGSRLGWGASSVVNYELVLPDSRIVNVNATSFSDLFWALKGGSNNFGIVTRFDMKTFPLGSIFGGSVVYDSSQFGRFFNAVTQFVTLGTGGGADDPDAAIVPVITATPNVNGTTFTPTLDAFHIGDNLQPRALENFTQIPTVSGAFEPTQFSSFSTLSNPAFGDRNSRWHFRATAVKATEKSLALINSTFTEAVTRNKKLSTVEGVSILVSIQPITVSWLQAAKDAGGDAISLDPKNGPFYVLLIVSQWKNERDDRTLNENAKSILDKMDENSKRAGIYYPFAYLNDASSDQNVFKFYGGGESLRRLKNIREKYDPGQFFRRYESSGFKLP